MDVRSKRFRLVLAGCAATVLLIWFSWWRSPDVQAPRTFALLQQAIADGSASGVLNQLHRDYDIPKHWPSVPWSEMGGDGDARLVASRALTALFFMHRDNRLQLAVDIASVTPGADGRTDVVVTLQLTSQQGNVPFHLGPIHRHRFTLASTGFTGHLAIVDHAPIDFSQ